MNEALTKKASIAENIEHVLIGGDLSKLDVGQRLMYYKAVCDSVGLNPLTKPFDYINLSGKLVLYAKRDATDQLRKIHGVSIRSVESKKVEDVFVVTAQAQDKEGRTDSSIGAVNIANLKGDALANALMKAETKAKRRVTLSICGLGLLDETEIETIPDARPVAPERPTTRAKAIPQHEDVICSQCGGKNSHLDDCPTTQKKTQATGKLVYVLTVNKVEQKKTAKGANYVELRAVDGNGAGMVVNVFHATPQKYAGLWVNKECEMEIEAKPSAKDPGKMLYSLSEILRVGTVYYRDNQPVPSEAPSSADLGFDEPQE